DWLTQIVAHVACAAYWFNPLVWLAARQMRIERERACDDIVLASGARASDYARELLALAAGLTDAQVSALVAVPMARRGALHDRLHGILDSRRSRAALTKSAVCLGAALAAAAMAPLAMLRAAPPESTESETAESETAESETVESEIFEPETVEPKKEPPFVPVETLELTVNTSRILTIGKPVPRVRVDNPEVVETTALSETKVRVMAKKPGRTQINLFDEDDNVYTVDTVIYPDARELRLSSRRQFPMDTGPAGRHADQVGDNRDPLTLSNPEVKEIWDLTLDEAVRIALANSKVLRNMGGILLTPAGPQSPTQRDGDRQARGILLTPAGPQSLYAAASQDAKDPGDSKVIRSTKVRFVLARTKDDIALADFEAGVRNMVNDVERAYWDLYYNYRNLNAAQAGRDSALQTWRKVHALYEEGAKGGEAEREAQAREQYFVFRAQVENTLGLLYTAESRLRYLMGLAPTDGRLLRPSEEPTTAEVRFDWNDVLSEGLNRGVELSQDQELEVAHVLTNALRDLDRNYQVTRTTFNRRVAAAKQVEAVKATYEMGTATLDMLLDAQRRLADAEIAYYRALVDYNIAILQVHYRKGSLLEYDGIMLTEGNPGGDVSD
ncbi:MAG: pilus assembly protein N-terminal domain-containing protein, partial [Pirellulales bacterium]